MLCLYKISSMSFCILSVACSEYRGITDWLLVACIMFLRTIGSVDTIILTKTERFAPSVPPFEK